MCRKGLGRTAARLPSAHFAHILNDSGGSLAEHGGDQVGSLEGGSIGGF